MAKLSAAYPPCPRSHLSSLREFTLAPWTPTFETLGRGESPVVTRIFFFGKRFVLRVITVNTPPPNHAESARTAVLARRLAARRAGPAPRPDVYPSRPAVSHTSPNRLGRLTDLRRRVVRR